jgi:FdrA protein
MGPDCGTAIINGMPLCFANVVRRGPVGVIGASGTGIQEVTCLIDRAGSGVSQAIGAGGRDLKNEQVGGATTLMGIEALAQDDDETKVIVIISKPPAKAVAEQVVAALERAGKPAVAFFVGAAPEARRERLGRPFRRQPRRDRRDGRRPGQRASAMRRATSRHRRRDRGDRRA